MALARLRSSTTDDAIEAVPRVPRRYDDPEFAAVSAVTSAFKARIERLKREKERLQLERHFEIRPPRRDSTSDEGLLVRLAALRAEPPLQPVAVRDDPSSASPAIAAGLRLLAGEPVATKQDLAEQIIEIDRQIDLLMAAFFGQNEIEIEVETRVNKRIATEIAPRWNDLQIAMFKAALELAHATHVFRTFRGEVVAAGIDRGTSTILRMVPARSPLMLGTESERESEISSWRRQLAAWGLLP